ncbi:YppG family protein [Virgibacillus sp. DJP39]|uniref:YppG family protein n=1 Tax=Virgibacillus sp. DJP39 TaxID=3409790 RepID=UPI003BB7845E
MYPGQPRRPIPPYPYNRRGRQPLPRRQVPAKPSLLSMFHNQEGKIDFNKISTVAQQVSSMYSQIRPIISTFTKK